MALRHKHWQAGPKTLCDLPTSDPLVFRDCTHKRELLTCPACIRELDARLAPDRIPTPPPAKLRFTLANDDVAKEWAVVVLPPPGVPDEEFIVVFTMEYVELNGGRKWLRDLVDQVSMTSSSVDAAFDKLMEAGGKLVSDKKLHEAPPPVVSADDVPQAIAAQLPKENYQFMETISRLAVFRDRENETFSVRKNTWFNAAKAERVELPFSAVLEPSTISHVTRVKLMRMLGAKLPNSLDLFLWRLRFHIPGALVDL